jgi:hypothetical protein
MALEIDSATKWKLILSGAAGGGLSILGETVFLTQEYPLNVVGGLGLTILGLAVVYFEARRFQDNTESPAEAGEVWINAWRHHGFINSWNKISESQRQQIEQWRRKNGLEETIVEDETPAKGDT